MSEPLPNSKQIGAAIRKLRTEKKSKPSIENLAHAANVSTSYMSNIENLKRNPSWDVVVAIVEALEVDLPKLISEAQAMPREPEPDIPGPKA